MPGHETPHPAPAGGVPIPPAASAATYPLRCSAPQWARFDNRQKRPVYQPLPSLLSAAAAQGDFRAPARATFVCGDKSSQKHRLDLRSKNPSRAMPVRCRPRFPSRNRRFPDRCRSPDCASTAFRCRCLLLRQKLFVLPCRRLLYPVPNGHTYLCRRKAAKARFDNRPPGRSKHPYRGWGKRPRQPPRR